MLDLNECVLSAAKYLLGKDETRGYFALSMRCVSSSSKNKLNAVHDFGL